jgi:Ran GTPase-activating protein (RanGAP) involved in mRNA processing and transport
LEILNTRETIEKVDLSSKPVWMSRDDALPEFDSLVLKGYYAETIDESHKKLGDYYCLALTEGLQRRTNAGNVKAVILKDNRLTDAGVAKVVAMLPLHLRHVDLSENTIRKKGTEALRVYLSASSQIVKLDLRKTNLTDSVIRGIASGIAANKECGQGLLTSLVLADNKIGDGAAAALARVIPGCSLTALDLSWNEINSAGAAALAEALLLNTTIASLDLSWNAIGSTSDKTRRVATSLAALLSQNTTLTHLDLSQNQLSSADCGVIGEGLRNNHSLLGLHITGNGGKVDAYGQLMADAEPWPLEVRILNCVKNIK